MLRTRSNRHPGHSPGASSTNRHGGGTQRPHQHHRGETNETGETGTEDAKRSCPAALKKKQHLFLVMNLDLTVPYRAVVVDFAECFVASFKEEEAVSSLRRKAESPWFEEEMRE